MKPKPLLFLVLFLFCNVFCFSESRFKLGLARDILISTGSAGIFTASLFPLNGSERSTPELEINRLDRALMFPFNNEMDIAGTVLACSALVLPAVPAAAVLYDLSVFGVYSLMYIQAFVLTTGIKDFIKGAVSRWRPYTYGPLFDSTQAGDDYYNSFPSGHTAYAFLGATVFAGFLLDRISNSPWLIPGITAGFTLGVATGITRVLSGEHFITDVLAGAAVGTLCGLLVLNLHRVRDETPRSAVSVSPQAAGISFSIQY